jgi:hypothetical protein
MKRLLILIPFCVTLTMGQTYNSSFTGAQIDAAIAKANVSVDTTRYKADSSAEATRIAAQVHDTATVLRGQFPSPGVGNVSDSLYALTREFDVLTAPFNADPTGAVPSSASIQKAIDSAYAHRGSWPYHNNTVFVPSGIYSVNSTLNIQNNITLKFAPGVTLLPISGFSDTVIAVYGSENHISGVKIEGWDAPGEFNFIGLALCGPNGGYVCWNHFSEIRVSRAKTALDMSTVGDGWVNANSFTTSWFQYSKHLLRMRQTGSRAGMSGNTFTACQFQVKYDTTTTVLDSLDADLTQFIGCIIWDNVGATSRLISTSGSNAFLGGNLTVTNFTDLAVNNVDINPRNLSLYGTIAPFKGSTQMRGTAQFDGTATTDTVDITSATINSSYIATPTWAGAIGANDILSTESLSGKLVVHRLSGGTSGLFYTWWKVE